MSDHHHCLTVGAHWGSLGLESVVLMGELVLYSELLDSFTHRCVFTRTVWCDEQQNILTWPDWSLASLCEKHLSFKEKNQKHFRHRISLWCFIYLFCLSFSTGHLCCTPGANVKMCSCNEDELMGERGGSIISAGPALSSRKSSWSDSRQDSDVNIRQSTEAEGWGGRGRGRGWG